MKYVFECHTAHSVKIPATKLVMQNLANGESLARADCPEEEIFYPLGKRITARNKKDAKYFLDRPQYWRRAQ